MQQIFRTPLSSQRYQWVEAFLHQHPDVESVTDVGCGNGRMLNWLKAVPHVKLINCIDSDANLIEYELDHHFRPNLFEMLFGRRNSSIELDINVFQGDIAVPDDRLKSDCFTMVEVIEHITLDRVSEASRTIFGYYKPKYVIVTTPNIETNHLLHEQSLLLEQQRLERLHNNPDPGCPFTLPSNQTPRPPRPAHKFRHFDHKFEWTRQQFCEWAQMISTAYNYNFILDGVGALPGSDQFGPCTQIALFKRVQVESNQPLDSISDCFDLLLNKLSVEEAKPEFEGDRNLKRICLIASFKIPGKTPEPEKVTYPSWDEDDFQDDICDHHDDSHDDNDELHTMHEPYSSCEPSSSNNW